MSKVIQFVSSDGLNLERTFDSVEEALADYQRLTGEGFNAEDEISLAVADDNGHKSFCVGSPFTFTNCLVEDIKSWKSWYEDAWLEKIVWEEEEE